MYSQRTDLHPPLSALRPRIMAAMKKQSIENIVGLTHTQTVTPFDALGNKPFENTVGKGEIARDEQFLLFPQCFLPVRITFFHFRQI